MIGGASIAFKNAMVGGVILGLIEGVSTIVTSVSMRRQYMFMEEEQKKQVEQMKRQMRKGGSDPWAVDYNREVATMEGPEGETMIDTAKSVSF